MMGNRQASFLSEEKSQYVCYKSEFEIFLVLIINTHHILIMVI